jgi:chemotaxis regulatin CheY-phosphate phosphatase CheZ
MTTERLVISLQSSEDNASDIKTADDLMGFVLNELENANIGAFMHIEKTAPNTKALETLAKEIHQGVFADRNNMSEALDYAYQLIETLPPKHRVEAVVALHVCLNTASKIILNAINERK